jgi:hypothetical protein
MVGGKVRLDWESPERWPRESGIRTLRFLQVGSMNYLSEYRLRVVRFLCLFLE